ncbi:hypothetical protein ACFSMW_18535 [Virgibacillus halophilus]|uniref:Holin n=1 Tax=Tigheibacillus halophilus TaxID=361280 RepID=A0ABU5C8F2_9BACI|nr:hypothetical protein [Virgibacillus halophilus]
MIEVQPYAVMLIPIILGLIEVAKVLRMPKRFAPLLAVILGILAGIFYVESESLPHSILIGIALGLSSVGLYSSTKNIIPEERKKQKEEE